MARSVRSKNLIVAQRSGRCRVCSLPPETIAAVNAVIWPDPGVSRARNGDYRAAAQRVCAANGMTIEVKTITRHAEHTERSWHRVTPRSPARPGEIAVVATDYQSMVEKAATMGAQAMDHVITRLPEMEDRDLIAAAKVGMGAVVGREALRLKAQEVDQTQAIVAALTGLASGHITEADIPDAEVINVTPPEVLLAQVHQTRTRLERLSQGEDPGAG